MENKTIQISEAHDWLIFLSKDEIDRLFEKYETEVLNMPEDELLGYMYEMEINNNKTKP